MTETPAEYYADQHDLTNPHGGRTTGPSAGML
jgi:hypothetical protein